MLNKSHSLHKAEHEIRHQRHPGESAMLPDTAINATFGQQKAWLRGLQIVHEHNAEILRRYQEALWFIPPYCMLPLELVNRSFSAYIECQQRITESIEQQLSARRIERTHSGIRGPVDSIERAMDIAIGIEGECEKPWVEAKVERYIPGSEYVLQTAPRAEAGTRKAQSPVKTLAAHAA